MDMWDQINRIAIPLIAFLGGLSAALWRAFSVINKVALLEQKTTRLEKDIVDLKGELIQIENRISSQLTRINDKLDGMY